MRGYLHRVFQVSVFLAFAGKLSAQQLPVGIPVLEDYYRRLQLTGNVDSSLSFVVRPLTLNALTVAEIADEGAIISTNSYRSLGNGANLQLMPITARFRYTTAYPIGWNDGGMIPAVGMQSYFSGGIYADYKWLSIQFMPEIVNAENRAYMGFDGQTQASWALWYEYANTIDMPERFGNTKYTRILPGQSSIRINYDALSVGLSTENLWWGPSRRNSLLMSNTAPGFPHLTLNTTKPVHSIVGSFEGQLVVGSLTDSRFAPTPLGNPDHFDEYYEPKPGGGRSFSGFILSYQPMWLSGLSIGTSRSFVTNRIDMENGLGELFPFFGREGNDSRLQYKSVFTRWMMPKGKLEFYAEYGRSDPGENSRDRFVQMDHSRAYILGFRKLVPIREDQQEFIDVGLELTQVDRTRTSTIRDSPSWYTHSVVRSGYTHLGQVLGAGVGPGGASQTLDVAWVKGLKKIGLQFERQEHQLDFFYDAVRVQGDFRRNWVDLSAKLIGSWDYDNLVFFGNAWFIKALNYQYELEDLPNPVGADYWNFERMDKFNFQANLGVMYRF